MDFDRFVTVFSSVPSRTFSLFLFSHHSSPDDFVHQPNGKCINSCKIKNIKNLIILLQILFFTKPSGWNSVIIMPKRLDTVWKSPYTWMSGQDDVHCTLFAIWWMKETHRNMEREKPLRILKIQRKRIGEKIWKKNNWIIKIHRFPGSQYTDYIQAGPPKNRKILRPSLFDYYSL